MRISALDRKLFRDLGEMKGQALAIAAVVASGVTMYVTYLSNVDSLRNPQSAYYERFRFGDVFAQCKRAPLRLWRTARRSHLVGFCVCCSPKVSVIQCLTPQPIRYIHALDSCP